MIEKSGAYDREPLIAPTGKSDRNVDIRTELLENIAGITDEDKKDLVHWMTYREKRPPSPSPQEIIEKIQKPSSKEKDRFSECKIRFFLNHLTLFLVKVKNEVTERQQFLEEMNSLGSSKKLKEEIEGEIVEKLREMKVLQKEREKQIRALESIKSKCNSIV